MLERFTGVAVTIIAAALLCGCGAESITPPALDELSATEREEQDTINLERWQKEYLGDFPDVDLPKVERVRYITNDEWPVVMAECLSEAGFTSSAGGGGLSSSAPKGQELPYGLAAYTCNAQYPINPREMMELSDDQIRYLYEYYTQVATPCLEDLGFQDLPEPPSKQSYISEYPNTSWDIYTTVADQASPEEWEKANELCPQTPKELFGG